MKMDTNNLIVGCGVTGSALANRLLEQKAEFLIVDKSRSVGGRLATRRDQEAKFDHGAQFFKVDSSSSQDKWIKSGNLTSWFEHAGVRYMVCPSGMNSLVKKSTDPFSKKIILNAKIETLESLNDAKFRYRIKIEDGTEVRSNTIYLTCPLPQSLQILRASRIDYDETLNTIRYAPALVGLFVLNKGKISETERSRLEKFKYQENISTEVFSIACQTSKSLCSELAYSVVMTPLWSERNFELGEDVLIDNISSFFRNSMAQLLRINPSNSWIDRSQIKKWRYSHPLTHFSSPHITVRPGLILLGDAFGGASISGALRSAGSIKISAN